MVDDRRRLVVFVSNYRRGRKKYRTVVPVKSFEKNIASVLRTQNRYGGGHNVDFVSAALFATLLIQENAKLACDLFVMDIFRLKSKKKQQAVTTSANTSTKSTSTSATDQLDQIAISTAEMETDATYAMDAPLTSSNHSKKQQQLASSSPKSTTKASVTAGSDDNNINGKSTGTTEPTKRLSITSGIDALLDSDDDEFANADIFNDGDNSSGDDDNITASSEQQHQGSNLGTPNSRRSTLSIKSKASSSGQHNTVGIPPALSNTSSTPASNIMAISPLSATSTTSSKKKLFHHDILDVLSSAMQDVTTATSLATSPKLQQSAQGEADQSTTNNDDDDDDDDDEIIDDNDDELEDDDDKDDAADDKSNNSESAEDYSDDEDEGEDGYKPGGYHPVKVGEVYNQRYDQCCSRSSLIRQRHWC